MTDSTTRQRNTSISSLTAGSVSESPTSTRPRLPRSNSSFTNIMNIKEFSRYGDEWSSDALTLLDVIETFFDSRLDLINRRLKAQSARLKSRAVELLPKQLRTPAGGGILLVEDDDDDFDDHSASEVRRRPGAGSQAGRGDKYRREVEKEVERIKVKLAAKVTHLSGSWRSAQIVRTREKVSFLFGVMSLTFTCLLYGMAPTWLPFAYTAQSAFYLPTRIWQYKKKSYHYFLFGGLCYFVNILDLVWIWIFPQSGALFICSYLLTMGPLASAIITWRNSLVFHSLDKVTSLFIHMYPPTVLSVILHVYPNAHERYPGLAEIQKYSWWTMILIAAVPYVIWQSAYYQFISVGKKSKIESGQRENSFHYMLNDKRGPIGKALKGIRPEHRELWFIFGQLIYSIVFMIPPAVLFIHSPISTSIFLITIFAVSAWNGASFYVEVFGRKFERELEKLRKEMETASATGGSVNGSTSVTNTPFVDRPTSPPSPANGGLGLDASPLVLPSTSSGDTPSKVDSFSLDRNDDSEEVLVDAKDQQRVA